MVMSKERVGVANIWYIALLSSFSSLFIFFLFFKGFIFPSLSGYMGLKAAYAVKDSSLLSLPGDYYGLGRVAASGALMKLDDVWSFQESIYQTMITFLTAINGVVAGLAFFYIKSNSTEAAVNGAVARVDLHIKSAEFEASVQEKVEEAISIRFDSLVKEYDEKYKDSDRQRRDEMNDLYDKLGGQNEIVDKIDRDYEDLKRYFSVVVKEVASRDREESDGSDLTVRG